MAHPSPLCWRLLRSWRFMICGGPELTHVAPFKSCSHFVWNISQWLLITCTLCWQEGDNTEKGFCESSWKNQTCICWLLIDWWKAWLGHCTLKPQFSALCEVQLMKEAPAAHACAFSGAFALLKLSYARVFCFWELCFLKNPQDKKWASAWNSVDSWTRCLGKRRGVGVI